MNAVVALPTLDELQQYVHKMLCERDKLEQQQTPLHRALITRAGKPCGLFFQVQGPRLLKTYALWTGEEERILFYDSQGHRYGETRLSEGPDVLKLAA